MNLTYQQLKDWLSNLTQEQLDMNVTVMIQDVDELYPVSSIGIPTEEDRLDEEHPVLYI